MGKIEVLGLVRKRLKWDQLSLKIKPMMKNLKVNKVSTFNDFSLKS